MLAVLWLATGCYTQYSVAGHVYPLAGRPADIFAKVDAAARPLGFELQRTERDYRLYVYTGRIVPRGSEIVRARSEPDPYFDNPEDVLTWYEVGPQPPDNRVILGVNGRTGRIFIRDRSRLEESNLVAELENALRLQFGPGVNLSFERTFDWPM